MRSFSSQLSIVMPRNKDGLGKKNKNDWYERLGVTNNIVVISVMYRMMGRFHQGQWVALSCDTLKKILHISHGYGDIELQLTSNHLKFLVVTP